jgi:hypothetical protein
VDARRLSGEAQAGEPSLAEWDAGCLAAWVELGQTRAHVSKLRAWSSSHPDLGATLAEAPALRHPAACAAQGLLYVACAVQAGREGWVEVVGWSPQEGEHGRWTLDRAPHLRARPAVLPLDAGRLLVVWEAHTSSGQVELRGARLDLTRPAAEVVVLARSLGAEQGPSLAAHGARVWLAWASDAPKGAPGLPRWVKLAELDPNTMRLYETTQPALGMNLTAKGEDQSRELPTLWTTEAGEVWLLARASHNFRAQRFGAKGWERAQPLDPEAWGCRGMKLAVAPLGQGQLWVVAHGRKGLQSQVLRAEGGKPPGAHLISSSPLALAPPSQAHDADHALWHVGGRRLWSFLGDIHFHTAHSDGVGTLEEAWLRCKARYGHDFACLTDHDAFLERRVTDGVWRQMVDVAEFFHAPEQGFAALVGIEYTGAKFPGPGHKCVYLPDADAPLVCKADALQDPAPLLARVSALGGFAIPHHVGWIGGDPEHHDPDAQPCWEVCSAHGQYEAERDEPDAPPIGYRDAPPGTWAEVRKHFLRRRLEAGQVFGFVGGSDGHGLLWHHGVSPKADSHRTGLTGVWLEALDRAAILDAIRARRTWATSGARIALGFTLDGAWMGSRLDQPPAGALEITYRATKPVAELVAFVSDAHGTRAVARHKPRNGPLGAAWRVDLGGALPQDGRACLYVRLAQKDKEVAWASPVFWG